MITPKDIQVLVVDDDDILRETLAAGFRRFGFNVEEANGGRSALAKLETMDARIVITDVRMPQGDGLELLKTLKSRDARAPTVFMISGFADAAPEDLYDLGAEGFFDKPFSATQVREAMAKALLAEKQRWNNSVTPSGASLEVSVPSLVGVGRGGFFIPMTSNHPQQGSIVPFRIQVADSQPCREISGVGRVKWVRKQNHGERGAGVGLEIQSLNGNCLNAYVDWLNAQSIQPYIPAG